MYEALVSMFGMRSLRVLEDLEPGSEDEVEYGGNSINDPNPSGNPDEDDD